MIENNSLDWAKRLIAFESVSGNEKSLCDFLEDQLQTIGGKLQRVENSLLWQQQSPDPNKQTVALVGHIDTVPFRAHRWQVAHPLKPLEKDGKLFGRGACDMKAGDAIILHLLDQPDIFEKYNVAAMLYEKEETGIPNGITGFIKAGVLPRIDLAIVLEPTEARINHGVLTVFDFKLEANGESVHSSKARQGKNAIYALAEAITKVREVKLNTIEGVEESLSVNMIEGGTAVNVVPDFASAIGDMRVDPRLSEDEVMAKFPAFGESVKFIPHSFGQGYLADINHPLLQELAKCIPADQPQVVPFWTDIGQLGNAGIPAINFGPGSIDQAHTTDEWIEIAQIEEVESVLGRFLRG
jgi:succinyl-diaminopimelate desuccinylase